MTKKQLAALQRIIDIEQYKRPNSPAGVHPTNEHFIVTDGYVAVMFSEQPDGLNMAEPMESIFKIIMEDMNHGNHCLVSESVDLNGWRQLARDWKKGKDHKSGATPVVLSTTTDRGETIIGTFNPRILVDAVEAVGTGAMLYLGYRQNYSHYPTLLVYPKDWMESGCDPMALVMPLRV